MKRRIIKKPFRIKIAGFLIELAAWIIRTENKLAFGFTHFIGYKKPLYSTFFLPKRGIVTLYRKHLKKMKVVLK